MLIVFPTKPGKEEDSNLEGKMVYYGARSRNRVNFELLPERVIHKDALGKEGHIAGTLQGEFFGSRRTWSDVLRIPKLIKKITC